MGDKLARKLEILADAAKYDASCSSSGGQRRNSRGSGKGVGSVTGSGICHSYTPDGRCVSLLKILMTNVCQYDCSYCINRKSSDTPRAAFTVEEIVSLTLDFYKRNYIEGLFLSSGIARSSDHTMEMLVQVAKRLRVDHQFRGYIHLKTIPEASQGLIDEAGRYADRLSINVELPTQAGLSKLAPEKKLRQIEGSMAKVKQASDENKDRRKQAKSKVQQAAIRKERPYVPAGQSTQMIIGADRSTDRDILHRMDTLYSNYQLRRVYYSAYSPIPLASTLLPAKAPPLIRENRLYQADWLFRFYGFKINELVDESKPSLDLDVDPKLSWALRNRSFFPLDLAKASREALLRVPGFGVRTVAKILSIRRYGAVRLTDLTRMKIPLKKVMPFIITNDYSPMDTDLDSDRLRQRFAAPAEQLFLPIS